MSWGSHEKQTTVLWFSLMLLGATAGCEDRAKQPAVSTTSRPSAVAAPSPAPTTSAPTASSLGPRPFELDEPIGFRVVARPEKVVCTLGTQNWKLNGGAAVLYPATDAKSFATVRGGEARLLIAEGQDRIAGVLEAEDSGLFIRGLVLRDQEVPDGGEPARPFPLHVVRPVVFGGCFIPKPATAMLWSDAANGNLVVQPNERAIEADQNKLRQKLSCADVSLDVPSFDPVSALKVKLDSLRRVSLGKARELALCLEPGGADAVRISLDDGFGSEARVLEEKGKHTRVLLESSGGFVFGWVESTLVAAVSDPAGLGLGGLGLAGIGHGGGGKGLLRPAEYVCPHEVRLLIDQTATEGAIRQLHRYVVGGFRANTTIVASEPKGERTAVLPRRKGARITFHFNQSELVFSSELEKCQTVAPKPKSSAGSK